MTIHSTQDEFYDNSLELVNSRFHRLGYKLWYTKQNVFVSTQKQDTIPNFITFCFYGSYGYRFQVQIQDNTIISILLTLCSDESYGYQSLFI